jgi:hypothetical protein
MDTWTATWTEGTAALDETKDLLVGFLDIQRAHVVGILEGLDGAALHQTMLPSGWSCLGLVHHLALDVERFWFRQVVAGEQIPEQDGATSAWEVDPGVTPGEVVALYRAEIDRADAIVEATPLEAPPRFWPDDFDPSFTLPNLRAVLLHVITETACHAGHLDAARELIDGRTWLIL